MITILIMIILWLISRINYHNRNHRHHYDNKKEYEEFVEEMLRVLTKCATIPPEVAANNSCQPESLET